MLHLEAVPAGALPILKRLMALPELRDHALVGGTALALRYGHRLSVDLDLFGAQFDHTEIQQAIETEFGNQFSYEPGRGKAIGVFCYIGAVKVDVVKYPPLQIREIEVIDGIRLYSDADIGAMKIQAILGRGKKKDFWDLSLLMKQHGLEHLMEWHKEKFPSQMLAISIPSAITYFNDAEDSEDPVGLQGQTWEEVKRSISKAVSDYLR